MTGSSSRRPTVYVYEVTGHEIVRPWQTEVIAPVPGEPGATPTEALLTMTSCHPKFSATQRCVVHGGSSRRCRGRSGGSRSGLDG